LLTEAGDQMKFTAAAIAAATALVVFAPLGSADPEQDLQLLNTLDAIGLEIADPALVLQHARMVCDEGLAHGVSWQEMRAQLMEWGYSLRDASLLIANATFSYCPEYTEVSDAIIADDQFTNAQP
jgi:hypothetical protein